MKKLLTFLRAYRRECVLAPLFKMLEAIFELFVPLVVAAIIDRGISGRETAVIYRMGILLAALGLIGLLCSVTAQFFAARAAVGCAADLRRSLFAHIQSLSYTALDRVGTSTLITRMTADVNQVQSGINLVLRLFLRSPFIVFGAMLMAFTVDVPSACIFALAIPVLSIIVFGIMCWSIPRFGEIRKRLDGVLGITRENLAGVRVIRAFGREEAEQRDFDVRNEVLTALQLRVGRISALMNPLTYVVINLAVIALIHTGAVRVNEGLLTAGEVVALYNYMSQILVELIKLANLIITINKSLACTDRINQVFAIPADMTAEASAPSTDMPGSDYAVEFRHVSFTYAGSAEPSLSNLTLRVKRGETVGIIGGTGAGKSTLCQLIPRFYDATEGSVLVNGTDVRSCATDELRRKIAVVPQTATLFAGTVRDNLLWGQRDGVPADDAALMAALETAQAKNIIEEKGGLDAPIAQHGRNLSGGQRQRLTIARALVGRPEILILDDSASALDYATDAALRQALRRLPDQTTVFIVSQRAASLCHADQIVVLDDGEVVGIGTHDQLLADCSVYAEIYYSQFEKEEA
ncbi:MAG: ABC transporter ATP-binding protein [Clostridia bacterium]|nr:ABC transporter ATP-binding protein [Clostridia bacterium]